MDLPPRAVPLASVGGDVPVLLDESPGSLGRDVTGNPDAGRDIRSHLSLSRIGWYAIWGLRVFSTEYRVNHSVIVKTVHRSPPDMSGQQLETTRAQPADFKQEGVVYGVASFVLGYFILYLTEGDQLMSDFTQGFTQAGPSLSELSQMGGSLPEKWQLTGQFYYVGHNADLSIKASAAGQSFTQTLSVNFFGGQNTMMWIAPIVALVVGGFLLARQYDFQSTGESAKCGAHVVAGYLPMAALGVFLFQWQTTIESSLMNASLTMQPHLMTSLLFAGVVYPVVLGAVGGALAHEM